MAASGGNAPQGGFWNAPKATYSQDTHNLLKEMMRESKLTNFQTRKLDKTLKDGGELPLWVPPSCSRREPKVVKKAPPSKVLNPRNYKGGVRSRETMEAQGAFEKPDYVPPRGIVRDVREKEKLANIMAYGEDMDPQKRVPKRVPSPPPEPDRFQELEEEIADRQTFMKEMEAMGHGEKYRQVIATEISQKLREMELIDKKRTRQLEDMINRKAAAAAADAAQNNQPQPSSQS